MLQLIVWTGACWGDVNVLLSVINRRFFPFLNNKWFEELIQIHVKGDSYREVQGPVMCHAIKIGYIGQHNYSPSSAGNSAALGYSHCQTAWCISKFVWNKVEGVVLSGQYYRY